MQRNSCLTGYSDTPDPKTLIRIGSKVAFDMQLGGKTEQWRGTVTGRHGRISVVVVNGRAHEVFTSLLRRVK